MKMLIRSLRIENNNIYMNIREDVTSVLKKDKHDIIVHLMNNRDHIGGYSLLRINYEGLLKFKRIGHNPDYDLSIELDHEGKLRISGVDLI